MTIFEKEPARPRARYLRRAASLAALLALSALTGWGAARLMPSAHAAPDTAKVRAALKLRLPKTPIDAIACKDLGGLCEVASKTTLFYVDAQAKYLVIGRVYDMEARQDLTAARLLQLNPDLLAAGAAHRDDEPSAAPQAASQAAATHVSLAGLPENGAIRWGPVDGPKVVVFSDFRCGYCKRLSAELAAIGARVEERPISIFGPTSRKDAERVLCSPVQETSLRLAYAGTALANPKSCDTRGLDANEAFAKAHGFAGTPVIVRPADGAVLEGYRPADALRAFLGATPVKNKR
ncbi:DsbC family protein [Novosphingobium sp.]|uniref:DsbC family protein n=1 Tax=Novosphingobium sp. TaxID=1874826 RepID=UPI00333ECFFC